MEMDMARTWRNRYYEDAPEYDERYSVAGWPAVAGIAPATVVAAGRASKAADYILGREREGK